MPSGRTHDRITLWLLPGVALLAGLLSRDGSLTLACCGTYLFAGLMFGPDLDIRSRQYARWGWLRWIWKPYQRLFRHRSRFTHGPLIGTLGRLLYLGGWLTLPVGLGLAIAPQPTQQWAIAPLQTWVVTAPTQLPLLLAILAGLELGAMSHSVSDWLGSALKRLGRSRRRPHRRHTGKRLSSGRR